MDLPSVSNRILYDVPCEVCRDHSSGKHYGVFACDGCAGFFKRSVRRDRSYTCKARTPGTCLVDKVHRNQCRACRLAKCIAVGMNRDAVQHERGPRNSTIRRHMGMFMQETVSSAEMGPPAPPVMPLVDINTPNSVPPPPPPLPFFNPINNRLNQLSISDLNYPVKPLPPVDILTRMLVSACPDVLCEGAARLLFINVKWAKTLPTFGSLSLSDRLLLLEESWKDLFILGSAQFLHPINLELLIDRSSVEINLGEVNKFVTVVRDIAEMQPDCNEYACLRAIALFKTLFPENSDRGSLINIGGRNKRLHDVLAIAALQTQTLRILNEWSSRINQARPCQLLQLLPRVREVSSSTIVELFFRPTIGAIPIERILTDMYTTDRDIC